ncbi:uncharacterized protein LOC134007877 [Osmerus eperlanus]|uniref:uncharacterized protein LOC134007877 n=1 Tax=Osmerus eperlanus TaxID=29151 RepID=UPI002E13F3D6
MAAICQPRRALMEICPPQPKIAARIRRSYMEILSSRLDPLSATSRSRNLNISSRRGQSLDTTLIRPLSLHDDHSDKMEDNQTVLSKQQLVQHIKSLITKQSQRQHVQTPTSDLKLLQEDLHLKKANVYRSIPYSRLESNRDAHCYRKAFPHLVAFKVSCQEGGRALLQREDWDSVLEHALVAWRYTSELPQWDTSSHNTVREQCFSVLAAHCLTSLQHQPPLLSRATELLRRFKMAQVHSSIIVPCIQELQRILRQAQESATNH